jgi:flagellar biosynthesis/type III secretory pathway chaperone
MEAQPALTALLRTLEQEEAEIVELIQLATEERSALIASDFPAVDSVTERMLQVAERIDRHEQRRQQLLNELGNAGAGLNEIVALAENHSVGGFPDARERLLERTGELQDLQEQNAQLILSAAKLRERWLAMLTRLANPTYGAGGQQQANESRFLSRSA